MKTNLSRIATPLRHTHHVGESLRDSIQRHGEMLLLVTILSWVVCPCLAQEVENAPAELVATIPLVPSDPEALELAEKIHRQATAIDKLSSFVVRTERRSSFHDYGQGVIGLQDERSLELLHKAIDVQLDTPPKSVNETVVGWHDKQFVWRKHDRYKREGVDIDNRNGKLWLGDEGWHRDFKNRFGRHDSFKTLLKGSYFRPSYFLYFGHHRFHWIDDETLPNFFLASEMPLSLASYQFLPDERFGGEVCRVIHSKVRAEQFWIGRDSGQLKGVLLFNSGWKSSVKGSAAETPEKLLRQFTPREFKKGGELAQWVKTLHRDDQFRLHAYMIQEAGEVTPYILCRFDDYREIADGIEIPFKERYAEWSWEGMKFRYDVTDLDVVDTTIKPNWSKVTDGLIPKKGDFVTDWRYNLPVTYDFDAKMTAEAIVTLVEKAAQTRQANQKSMDQLTMPFQMMVGKKAPAFDHGQWLGGNAPELTGKRYFIHFWAVWCGPCKTDIPKLNRLAEQGFGIIGVHAPGTEVDRIASAIKELEIKYPVFAAESIDSQQLGPDLIAGYPVQHFPYCVVVGADGNVATHGPLNEIDPESSVPPGLDGDK